MEIGVAYVFGVLAYVVPISYLDTFLKNRSFGDNHRWCIIHSAVNVAVVLLTLGDTLALLSSDNTIFHRSMDRSHLYAASLVMALHVYHIMAFKIDQVAIMVHHGLMMTVLCIPFINHAIPSTTCGVTSYTIITT